MPSSTSSFDSLIRGYYDSPAVAESYASHTSLHPAEEAILRRLGAELSGASLLDVGIGPGRTTPYLRAACRHYTGIDYSWNMLRHARARHPEAALLLCDARALGFAGGSFDAIFFCFNAIGDVGHEDRLRILREIRRALRPAGVFVFSAHNRDAPLPSVLSFPRPRGITAPGAAAGLRAGWERLRRYGRGIRNHLRRRRYQRRTAGFAILTDFFYEHDLLTYYISRDAQTRQLETLGFCEVEAVGVDGAPLASDAVSHGGYIYYVARRAPDP